MTNFIRQISGRIYQGLCINARRSCASTSAFPNRLKINEEVNSLSWNQRNLPQNLLSPSVYQDYPHSLHALERNPLILPSVEKNPMVYTFPTISKSHVELPTVSILKVLEKFDPLERNVFVDAPSYWPVAPVYASPRLLGIRRHKMRKHKRRKRRKRDAHKYMVLHRARKAQAEKLFRARMNEKLKELKNFNAEEYVKDVIKRANQTWSEEMIPVGKKLYPSWSTLITLEELFDLPVTDYIDKRSGLASEEDEENIKKLREKYYKNYVLNKHNEK